MSDIDSAESSDDLVARTTTSNVFGGLLWTVTANLAGPLLVLGTSVAAARFLGPADMGRQSFIAFTAISASLVLSGGMSGALLRFVGHSLGAGRGPALRGALRVVWRLQVGAALLAFAALAGYGATLGPGSIRTSWFLAAGVSALTVLQTVPSSVLVGAQQWRRAGIIGLTTSAVGTAATIAVLAAGGGIPGMFAVEVVAVAVNLGWVGVRALHELRRLAPQAGDPDGLVGQILRFAAVASVQVVLAYVVWQRSEFFFLDRYSVPAQIAVFSIAFAAASAVQKVLEAVSGALYPALATLLGAGQHERIRSAVGRALRLLCLLTTPLVVGLMVVGPGALRVIYGADYSGTGVVLVVLLVVLPLVTMARVAAAALHAFGRLRLIVGCLCAATAVDIALCLVLVPAHDARGAAGANIAAQAVAATLQMWCVTRVVGSIDWQPAHLLRGVAAAVVAGAAGFAVVDNVDGFAGVVAAGAACLVAYVVAVAALRPFPAADVDWLEAGAGHRLGGAIGALCRWARHASTPAARVPAAGPGVP